MKLPSINKTIAFFCCFIFLTIFSQSAAKAQPKGIITGNVISRQQPVEYATVSLASNADTNKILNQAITDSLGNFVFQHVAPGSYQIRVSLIGYLTITQQLSIYAEQNTPAMVKMQINPANTLLTDVTVTAQKKLIQKTSEGFIVNAAANITQIGGTATDLLKNTPTVAVDADGGITLRGKAPLLLINDRNSAFSSIDQIPASSIESIEIINNASARYDANAQSGIINIKLKKNKTNGTNGSIALGAGVGSRGRTANALTLNHKSPKWNLGFNYDNRFAGRTKHIIGNRTNFNFPETYILSQDRNDKRVERLQNIRFNADFAPNAKNTFSFEAIGSGKGQDNDETLRSSIFKQSKIFSSANSRHSLELQRSKLAEFTLGFNRKFSNSQKLLTASINTSIDQDRENTDINTQSLLEDYTTTGNVFWQKTHNYSDDNVSNAILDYAVPLSATALLEMGYKATFRHVSNNYLAADKVADIYITNANATNIFRFSEQIHAAYLQYHHSIGKEDNPTWKYDIGARVEQVNNNGKTQNSTTRFSNEYLRLFPSAALSWILPSAQTLKLSYAKRINRPDLEEFNPFVDITDSLNPHTGNPALQPELIDAIELGYNREWQSFNLSSSIFFRHSKNTIRSFSQILPSGAVLRLPVNIGSADSYGFENIFSARPSTRYDVNVSLTLFQQQLNGSNIEADAVQKGFNWYGKVINNFNFSSKSKVQLIGNYNSDQITPQGHTIALYNLDMGFQQKLGKGNARLGIIIVDVFNTLKSGSYVTTADFVNVRTQKADTRAIMLTFAYSFRSTFKEKLLENKFSKEF